MNFPFKIVSRPAPSAGTSRTACRIPLRAAWSRDPKTGRLAQAWRSSDDGERSCTRRPPRPPPSAFAGPALAA